MAQAAGAVGAVVDRLFVGERGDAVRRFLDGVFSGVFVGIVSGDWGC
jgi:hypothetical protein